jgi:ubiquinone/menaquinone biosynthesis C-methylase UbiE
LETAHWSGRHLEGVLDPEAILAEIGITRGQSLLDAGCGEGRFAIPAASMLGDEGKLYAADTSEERIGALREAVRSEGLDQIEAFVADLTDNIPVPSGVVDVCLMANVFHGLVENGVVRGELREIKRVLRPEGVLAILDFRKDVDRPPGPPVSRRVDPGELERLITQYGFRQRSTSAVGSYHYLSIFILDDATA